MHARCTRRARFSLRVPLSLTISSRALTWQAFENTNYYFDVTQPHLHDALDRFAQFFLCPCFTESATSRELKAVDSENAKNLQADNWRLMQLYKSTADPAHPFHKFGTGNLSTLRDRPEDVVGLELRAAPGGEVALKLTEPAPEPEPEPEPEPGPGPEPKPKP